MKSIFLIYAPALESEVFSALERTGIKKYTKFPTLHGVGGHSEPHLDTQVWPGTNTALLIVTDEKTKMKLLIEVAEIKKEYHEDGIKAFVMNVEEEV